MSKDASPISVIILDKEYLINCEDKEREPLRNAVDHLNRKMLELKNSGTVIGSERIAVMTALNITNELLAYKKENQDYTYKIENTLKRLQSKINDALASDKHVSIVNIDNPVSQGS